MNLVDMTMLSSISHNSTQLIVSNELDSDDIYLVHDFEHKLVKNQNSKLDVFRIKLLILWFCSLSNVYYEELCQHHENRERNLVIQLQTFLYRKTARGLKIMLNNIWAVLRKALDLIWISNRNKFYCKTSFSLQIVLSLTDSSGKEYLDKMLIVQSIV